MRRRLTVAFVLFTVTLGTAFFAVQALLMGDTLRAHERAELDGLANSVARIVTGLAEDGEPVTAAVLEPYLDPDSKVIVQLPDGGNLVVAGPGYHGSATSDEARDDDLWTIVESGDVSVIALQHDDVVHHLIADGAGTLVLLLLAGVVVAAVVGHLLARQLAAPFRRLAGEAAALGRGRFDLDLDPPGTQVAEAEAIADGLRTSAVRLQERLRRQRQLAEHTSHVLRTPLTGLRLEMEDLAHRDDLLADVRASLERSLDRVERLDAVAGELVALARQGSLAGGQELALRDLSAQITQRWSTELAHHERSLTVTTGGDLSVAYSPGPLEQIMDLLLLEVIDRTGGDVRLRFDVGAGDLLTVEIGVDAPDAVAPPTRSRRKRPDDALTRARAIAGAMGGRIEADWRARGVRMRMPRW